MRIEAATSGGKGEKRKEEETEENSLAQSPGEEVVQVKAPLAGQAEAGDDGGVQREGAKEAHQHHDHRVEGEEGGQNRLTAQVLLDDDDGAQGYLRNPDVVDYLQDPQTNYFGGDGRLAAAA
ncbi:hypothetical protein TYRP_021742 [Tyrophagus putrescentiae]|nr:hypothetical protein TYRP_021742 [Tyrophagus putrescentiae]